MTTLRERMLRQAAADAAMVDGEWGCGCSAADIRKGKCESHGGEHFRTWERLVAEVPES